MTLIVEDGTAKTGAESYISVADADTRHTNLANTAWTDVSVTTPAKEAALRKATNYLTQQYRDRWIGYRLSIAQALDWPRVYVIIDANTPVASDIVPNEVKNACADLALKALSADLAPDLTQAVVSETVGSISIEYERGSPQQKRYVAIDAMLSPYLEGGGAMSRLIRT